MDPKKELKDIKNVTKMMKKPDSKEYSIYLKMTFVGLLVVGAVGFLIQLLGAVFGLMGG